VEVLYLAIVLAKSFIAVGDEEILLEVKVIAKEKKAFPDNAGLSCYLSLCREERDSSRQGLYYINYYYYHNNHFTAPRTLSRTTRISQYQRGETRKVKSIWIYWSKR